MKWRTEPDTGARYWEPGQEREIEVEVTCTVRGTVYTDDAGNLQVDGLSIHIDDSGPYLWAVERVLEKAVDDGE